MTLLVVETDFCSLGDQNIGREEAREKYFRSQGGAMDIQKWLLARYEAEDYAICTVEIARGKRCRCRKYSSYSSP